MMTKSDLELILTALTYVGKPKDAIEQSDYDLARTAIDIVKKQINEKQPAQEHLCTYSRAINQQYPRKCIRCGKVEGLAQTSQKPVGGMETLTVTDDDGLQSYKKVFYDHENYRAVPVYTTPLNSVWQGLSEEEINALKLLRVNEAIILAIEQALKEKNT